jgi:hypothetical protein
VETRGGDRATHRYIGYRGFKLTENFCHRGIRNSEIVRLDQGRPSAGTRGRDREPVGISEIEGTRCRSISASEVAKSREVIRTVHHRRTRGGDQSIREISRKKSRPSALRESGNRESRGQEVHTFWNCEVRNPDKEESSVVWGPADVISGYRGFQGQSVYVL